MTFHRRWLWVTVALSLSLAASVACQFWGRGDSTGQGTAAAIAKAGRELGFKIRQPNMPSGWGPTPTLTVNRSDGHAYAAQLLYRSLGSSGILRISQSAGAESYPVDLTPLQEKLELGGSNVYLTIIPHAPQPQENAQFHVDDLEIFVEYQGADGAERDQVRAELLQIVESLIRQ